MNIIQSIAASWIGRIGLLGIALGAVLMAYSAAFGLPARSSLNTVDGTVAEATRITRTATRRGQGARVTGVDFVLSIAKPGGGEPIKLSIPSDEITQDQVVALIGKPVKAEYDGERDVYALSSQGREVISYNTAWKKRADAIQVWAERGKFFLALAVPLALVGWPLGARKRRKQAAA